MYPASDHHRNFCWNFGFVGDARKRDDIRYLQARRCDTRQSRVLFVITRAPRVHGEVNPVGCQAGTMSLCARGPTHWVRPRAAQGLEHPLKAPPLGHHQACPGRPRREPCRKQHTFRGSRRSWLRSSSQFLQIGLRAESEPFLHYLWYSAGIGTASLWCAGLYARHQQYFVQSALYLGQIGAS